MENEFNNTTNITETTTAAESAVSLKRRRRRIGAVLASLALAAACIAVVVGLLGYSGSLAQGGAVPLGLADQASDVAQQHAESADAAGTPGQKRPDGDGAESGDRAGLSDGAVSEVADVDADFIRENPEGAVYKSGSVLVNFKPGLDAEEALGQLAADSGIEGISIERASDDFVELALPEGVSVADATNAFAQSPTIDAVQPNYLYYLMDDGADAAAFDLAVGKLQADWLNNLGVQGFQTDDPAGDQWMLDSIRAYDAWDIVRTEGKVTVAVMDNQFDVTHEDLAGNVVVGYNAVAERENVGMYDSSYKEIGTDYYHGTHVAGIVAAQANNATGIAGVSYNAQLLPIRVMEDGGGFSTATLVNAFEYLIDHQQKYNIRVVNISLGSPFGEIVDGAYAPTTGWESAAGDDMLLSMIDDAWDAGIVTVTSAGNSGTYIFDVDGTSKGIRVNVPFSCWPGDYNKCVNVININSSLARSSSSNYNLDDDARTKDISAPGSSITSTMPENSYASKSGTSMAAPCVAGVMALMFAANPDMTPDEAVSRLYSSAKDLDSSHDGFDAQFGYGEVDALDAVDESILSIQGETVLAVEGSTRLTLTDNNTSDWVWTSGNESIATVEGDAAGATVVGKKPGSTTIIAHANGDDAYRSFDVVTTVTVYDASIQHEGNFMYGTSTMFKVSDENPPGTWIWESSDSNIVEIGAQTGVALAKSVGTATVTATLNSNPAVQDSLEVTVLPADMSTAQVYLQDDRTISQLGDLMYTGEPIVFSDPRVQVNGAWLADGIDYTLSYENNTEISTDEHCAKLVATGQGNYTGVAEFEFRIGDKTLSSASVNGSTAFDYTGKPITLDDLKVIANEDTTAQVTLEEGQDYTVEYADNTNAGTATVTIAGVEPRYGGSKAFTFTISQIPITAEAIQVSAAEDKVYTGDALEQDFVLTFNGQTLAEGADYEIQYQNNVDVGTAVAQIYGSGTNFFTPSAGAAGDSGASQDGETVPSPNDETVYSPREVTFEILPANLAEALVVLPEASYVYNGSAITPKPVVTLGGRTLDEGKDYAVSYANNTNAGTATITLVPASGNFVDKNSATFSIAKAENPMTVKVKKPKVKYSKVHKKKVKIKRAKALKIQNAQGTLSFKKVGGSKRLSVAKKTGAITVKKNTVRKTYKVKMRVTASGNVNYKAASKVVTVKVRVA